MSDGLRLLGAILDTGNIQILREIDRHLFIDDELPLYDLIRAHYRRYGQFPAVSTIEEELGIHLPEAEETVPFYMKRVHDRRLYGIVRERFSTLKGHLQNFDMDSAKEVIHGMHMATRVAHTETDIRTIREAALTVLQQSDDAHMTPGISGVPTGHPRLDNVIGGYQPGDLITIVARPSQGKTWLLLNQATNAWKMGYSVLIVTMEMSIEQVARRIVAIDSRTNPDFIRKGTLSNAARRRLSSYVDRLVGTDRLKIFSGGMRRKISDVDLLIQEYQPSIAFIDGVYLAQPDTGRSLQRNEKVAEIFDEVKKITLARNIPVAVTTQFNRQSGRKGKDGSLENIAYTDTVSTHSSIIMSIGDGDAPNERNQRCIQLMKGREGEEGKFYMNFKFTPVDFSEVVTETNSTEEEGGACLTPGANLDWML